MVLKRLLRFERHVCGFTSYFFLFLLTFVTILLTFLMKTSRVETRSLPALARCYPRSFTFYVAHPARSILTSSFFLLPFFCASAVTPQSEQASGITAIVQKAMKSDHLRAVIVKVTQGDKVVMSQAFGESMTGVPATTAMHFPNGAVAFAYVSTLLMEFVDETKVKLDDTIERWMPTLPEANKVTLKMLANQTAGYPDFETDPAWLAAWSASPFHIWTFEERLKYAFGRPVQFAPGTNWSYAHTNFMILGEILSKNRQETAGRAPARKGPYPDGPEKHHRLPDFRYPEPSPARIRLRTPDRAQDSCEHRVLRRIIVLGRAMGEPARSERDDEHRRHGHDPEISRH